MRFLLATLALLFFQTTQPMMTAVQIHEFGGSDKLIVEQIAKPVPRDGEMLVRVFAAGVNPVDWKMRESGGRMGRKLPWIPGFDVSGVVEAVGPKVTKFKTGDAVFAFLALGRGGGYAQYVLVKEPEAAMKPSKISHIDAAGVPLVALTAWQAIFDKAKLAPGQSILIHGGAGGVGSFAVQLAKWKGAKVYATASTDNQETLRKLGVDVPIDYKSQKFDEIAKDVDVVLDTIGGQTQAASWKCLKKGGVLVSIVGRPKSPDDDLRGEAVMVQPSSDELSQISKLIDDGNVVPLIGNVFPLEDAAKAMDLSQTGHARGKIVLQVVNEK